MLWQCFDACTKLEKLPRRVYSLVDAALKAGLFKGYDRFLASATLVELDDCSHWIQADCPREVNDEIENFMEKLGQG